MPIVIKKEFHCPVCGYIKTLDEYITTTSSDLVCLACGSIFDLSGNVKIGDSQIRGWTHGKITIKNVNQL